MSNKNAASNQVLCTPITPEEQDLQERSKSANLRQGSRTLTLTKLDPHRHQDHFLLRTASLQKFIKTHHQLFETNSKQAEERGVKHTLLSGGNEMSV